MKAKTFDRKFDAADKIIDQLDLRTARRIGTDPKRGECLLPGLDGGLPGPGGTPHGRHAAVFDQAVAR
jgi:hypothetical protein